MKAIIIAILLTAFSFSSFAQSSTSKMKSKSNSKSSWQVTPVVGVIGTRMNGTTGTDQDFKNTAFGTNMKAGVAAGMNITIPNSSSYLGYNTGLIYSKSKTEFISSAESATEFVDWNATLEMQRLSVPLTASLFPFKKHNGIFVKAGLVGHYFIEGKVDGTISSGTFDSGLRTSSNVSKRDASYRTTQSDNQTLVADAVAGVGFSSTGRNGVGVLIEAQFQKGLTNIVRAGEEGADLKADSVQATAGLNFSF